MIIVGSQAILGTWDESQLPEEAPASLEVDIYPLDDDAAESLATRLDALIGEWSPFHQTHGFYIQGVGRKTAVLPDGWEGRLVEVSGPMTNGRTGLCLDPHDLCLAKLVANREKDRGFVYALLRAKLVSAKSMLRLLPSVSVSVDQRERIAGWIAAVS